ncbi:hypothetical protein [Vibrio metoecus]|uniref:F4 family fimbrial subunit n=1 Tax=Vibrio metoecus TaxID=1481663 RepID=UPI0001B99D29|nr:hypothetical protein [Vibrio metoecus]EEX67704.1 hypothetical protein VCJ_000007 [Vibrio metoecus]
MMKKTLLAAATASALVVSGGALAAFADAPKGEGAGASAQLKITGTLTNTNPNWMWQIPADAQAAVKDVTLKKITGVVNGANTEFSITTTPMSILEGYMKTPAPTGGAGLTPVINVGGTDMVKDCSAQAGCTISVDAMAGEDRVGKVAMAFQQEFAEAYHIRDEVHLSGKTFNNVATKRAVQVLESNQQGFWTTYPLEGMVRDEPAASGLFYDIWLSSPSSRSLLSASRVSVMKSSKLVVPTGAVPATWAATLPITISLK